MVVPRRDSRRGSPGCGRSAPGVPVDNGDVLAVRPLLPAVVFAALYGGWRSGLVATALSAALTAYFWMPTSQLFTSAEVADWLGLVIFLISGVFVTWVAEGLHRARARAAAAETQALLAAQREAAALELRKTMPLAKGAQE